MTAPSKQLDQFVVRFPAGLRDRIRRAADAANRSMNAEIVTALEERYGAPKLSLAATGTGHRTGDHRPGLEPGSPEFFELIERLRTMAEQAAASRAAQEDPPEP